MLQSKQELLHPRSLSRLLCAGRHLDSAVHFDFPHHPDSQEETPPGRQAGRLRGGEDSSNAKSQLEQPRLENTSDDRDYFHHLLGTVFSSLPYSAIQSTRSGAHGQARSHDFKEHILRRAALREQFS